MIIKDLKDEFFKKLKGRILIMCALDVDAICACRILQFLLESYNLQYSVAPVTSVDQFLKSFEEYRSNVDAIILVNFGNSINIPVLLKPADSLLFYVIDSHRPINVYNYYKNPQVKIFTNKDERSLNIPRQSEIFLKNDTGTNSEEEEARIMDLLAANPRDLSTEQLEQRRELRKWMIKKNSLMFEYQEFHFYNRSVSIIMYELACYLSKNNNYLLWLSIVGLTYQLKTDKIDEELYENETVRLVRHISRNQVSGNQAVGNNWTISLKNDLLLDLYRKWNLYDSLWHTQLSVCNFQLWNDKGQRNLFEFLVECGVKVAQSKMPYVAMDLDFRYGLVENVSKVCLGPSQYKYNLQDLIGREFVMKCAFKHEFCANDIVLALRGLLESHDPNSTTTERFVRAIQSLAKSDDDAEFIMMYNGFLAAQIQMKSMFEQMKALIANLKVIDEGCFIYADLAEHNPTISRDFARGASLMTFARFLVNAYVSSRSTRLARRASRLPLILFSPNYYNMDQVFVVGVPPVDQKSKKNFFGTAFLAAAANIECEIKADLSEPNLVTISADYKNHLLDQMKQLLES